MPVMLWGLLAPPRLGQQRHLVQAPWSDRYTLDHVLLMPHTGSEKLALVRVTPRYSEEVILPRPGKEDQSALLRTSGRSSVCVHVCVHARPGDRHSLGPCGS